MKPMKNVMNYQQLYDALLNRILKGKGHSSQQLRQAAFDNNGLPQPLDQLINKVAHHAYKITDTDIANAKSEGLSEDELFELIICGAAGQASRQYQSGLIALAEAMKEGGRHAS